MITPKCLMRNQNDKQKTELRQSAFIANQNRTRKLRALIIQRFETLDEERGPADLVDVGKTSPSLAAPSARQRDSEAGTALDVGLRGSMFAFVTW